MKIKSGQLYLSNREEKDIRLLLEHVRTDLSFFGGGTFNLGDDENSFDEKSANKVIEAIEGIEWILKNALIK